MNNRRQTRLTDRIAYVVGFLMIAFAIYLLLHENGKIDSQRKTLSTQAQTIGQQTQEIADLEAKLGTSHVQLVDGCKRQVIRDIEANIANRDSWEVDKFFLLATQHPIAPPRNAKEKALTAQFIKPIKDVVRDRSWIPVTNCETVVAIHGSHYRPPHPVPFIKRTPPKEAVTLSPALFR